MRGSCGVQLNGTVGGTAHQHIFEYNRASGPQRYRLPDAAKHMAPDIRQKTGEGFAQPETAWRCERIGASRERGGLFDV